jgi:ATP-dependent Clp protease ATP-binding subunit ClpC
MTAALKGLLSQAQRLARKRGQSLTTAHVLLALHQRTRLTDVLAAHGVGEAALIEALGAIGDEHPNVLALAVERAQRPANGAHAGDEEAVERLLLALTREPRSLAYACLLRLGVAVEVLQRALLGGSEAPERQMHLLEREMSAPARAHSSAAMGIAGGVLHQGRARRMPLALSAQQRLAVETELRRARDRARRDPARTGEARAAAETTGVARIEPRPAQKPAAPRAPKAASSSASAPSLPPFVLEPERFPLLSSLGRDLCQSARDGRIDPVLGRDAEIEQLLDVLTRRRANNPILVGPPGVGKTAIVEGVALALVRGRARGLEGRVLIELPPAALVSGTGVRGALSERLQALTNEIAQAHGRVIVFLDEIHGVISNDEGADSLAQGLKAALARGELPCIGATTEAEYRRIFERDAALARRFTRVDVAEPSKDTALAILRGLAPEYEKHHGVAYEPAALEAAVEMSVRFLPERHLPDKAVALIDQAGARARRRGEDIAGVAAVAEVVSELGAVPIERLLMRDGEALLALEAHLERRVIGQDAAAAAIADALRKSAAGFRGNRPLGTFLFLGPTGVGKTEMAKAMAELLFPGREPTRIDMSEMSEAHSVARLLGSPPGYVGHEDGGQLTEAVRARPYSLVLLDEIEKAHREVLLALLPLLDEGRLQDGRGRTIDFRNTVIVMTSNLGAAALGERARVGFGAQEAAGDARGERVLRAARAALPPELWNRIDEPLFFAPLDRASVAGIAKRMLVRIVALARSEHGIALHIEDSAIEALIRAGGYDPELGARPMRRTLSRLVESPLAHAVLAGELRAGDSVALRGAGERIVFERAPVAGQVPVVC